MSEKFLNSMIQVFEAFDNRYKEVVNALQLFNDFGM